MALLKVLGLDPSLNNWGIAAGTYDTITKKLTIKHVNVIKRLKDDSKRVRQNSKDLAAAQAILKGLQPYLVEKPVVFAEVPIGSQSARAMASYGICVGILGAIRATGTPFFEVTPTEVKLAATGDKNATKEDMIAYGLREHPVANWPRKNDGTVVAGSAEHMADACGAIVAGLTGNEFQQLAAMQQL